jgi:hypothetical protein
MSGPRKAVKWIKAESRKSTKGVDLRTRVAPNKKRDPRKPSTRDLLEWREDV